MLQGFEGYLVDFWAVEASSVVALTVHAGKGRQVTICRALGPVWPPLA